MTIQVYFQKQDQIRAWWNAGTLTTGEFIDRMQALNSAYLQGKGSFLLPVRA